MRRTGAVVVALVAAGLALSACTPAGALRDDSPGSTGGGGAARWPVDIDSSASGMALAGGGLVVVTPGGTKFPPLIYRYGVNGARQARQAIAGNPNGLAIGPDGSAWVPAITHPDMQSGTGMQVVDPVSLTLRHEVQLSATPLAVAFAGGQAWVGTGAGIELLDNQSLAVKKKIKLPSPVFGLVTGPGGRVVVTVQDGLLTAYDAFTAAKLASRKIAATGSISAILAANQLWVAWPVDGGGELRQFSLPALTPGPAGPSFGVAGVALAATSTALWVADHTGHLLCVDPITGRTRNDRPVPSQSAIAADDQYVYVGAPLKIDRVPASCG